MTPQRLAEIQQMSQSCDIQAELILRAFGNAIRDLLADRLDLINEYTAALDKLAAHHERCTNELYKQIDALKAVIAATEGNHE